jgi:hypothetical protein
MATQSALKDLANFNTKPTVHNASLLVSIPALYDVLKYEETRKQGQYTVTVLGVSRWIEEWGKAVLQKLVGRVDLPLIAVSVAADGDW